MDKTRLRMVMDKVIVWLHFWEFNLNINNNPTKLNIRRVCVCVCVMKILHIA